MLVTTMEYACIVQVDDNPEYTAFFYVPLSRLDGEAKTRLRALVAKGGVRDWKERKHRAAVSDRLFMRKNLEPLRTITTQDEDWNWWKEKRNAWELYAIVAKESETPIYHTVRETYILFDY
jgi:hypothetical protein